MIIVFNHIMQRVCKHISVHYASNDKSRGNQWFLLSRSGVINIPQMFWVLQEQNVKTFSSAELHDQICKLILVFIVESPKYMIAFAKLHFKAYECTYKYTLCAKKQKRKRNTNRTCYWSFAAWVGVRWKKAQCNACTQRTLCTSNNRTTLPHTARRSNLHHRSPGSCSKCIQSSPTHTNFSYAKNTMCPCAHRLYPGQP